MMGRLDHDQRQLFYSFCLEDAVPQDHLVRAIAGALDLSWVHTALAPHYPKLGRPSIDPVLMIRMLVVGYVFAIRLERALCRDVQVNLAYRWFCGLSIEDKVPDHSAFSRARNERFRHSDIFRTVFERVVAAWAFAIAWAARRSVRVHVGSDRAEPSQVGQARRPPATASRSMCRVSDRSPPCSFR
jgi:transposase